MKSEISSSLKRKPSKQSFENSDRSVSYSQNIFLPVTNLCRNECAYCGFRKDPENAWIMSKQEIMTLVEKGKKDGCSEALITLGERPEEYDMMREKLDEWGYDTCVDYLVDLSKEILKRGVLPHTNAGVLNKDELAQLRKWNASIGLMLESATELSVHEKSPGKNPKLRFETIQKAGGLKIPFTTGILIGIGENWENRIKSLLAIRKLSEKYQHIQEVIIQPFTPKEGTPMSNESKPSHSKILNTVISAKSIMPEMNIQVPPNLTKKHIEYLLMGANDLGGISTITPDFINPENPWPEISQLKSEIEKSGFELKERLPIYPEFVKNPDFMSPEVSKVVEKLSDEDGYRR